MIADCVEITTSKGRPFLVSRRDEWLARSYRWTIDSSGYALTSVRYEGHAFAFRFHSLIVATLQNQEVDHKNRNRLDNRRENLRAVTRSQNNRNSGLSRRNRSGHKGVFWSTASSAWVVQIGIGNRRARHIGRFADKAVAIEARRAAEIVAWGATHDVAPNVLEFVRAILSRPTHAHRRLAGSPWPGGGHRA